MPEADDLASAGSPLDMVMFRKFWSVSLSNRAAEAANSARLLRAAAPSRLATTQTMATTANATRETHIQVGTMVVPPTPFPWFDQPLGQG